MRNLKLPLFDPFTQIQKPVRNYSIPTNGSGVIINGDKQNSACASCKLFTSMRYRRMYPVRLVSPHLSMTNQYSVWPDKVM